MSTAFTTPLPWPEISFTLGLFFMNKICIKCSMQISRAQFDKYIRAHDEHPVKLQAPPSPGADDPRTHCGPTCRHHRLLTASRTSDERNHTARVLLFLAPFTEREVLEIHSWSQFVFDR